MFDQITQPTPRGQGRLEKWGSANEAFRRAILQSHPNALAVTPYCTQTIWSDNILLGLLVLDKRHLALASDVDALTDLIITCLLIDDSLRWKWLDLRTIRSALYFRKLALEQMVQQNVGCARDPLGTDELRHEV